MLVDDGNPYGVNFGNGVTSHKCYLLELLDIVRSVSFEPSYFFAVVLYADNKLAACGVGEGTDMPVCILRA